MENIRDFHRSQKNDIESVKKEINELTNYIDDIIFLNISKISLLDPLNISKISS